MAASSPTNTSSSMKGSSTNATEKKPSLFESLLGAFAPYLIYIAIAVVLLIAIMGYLAWRGRPTATLPKEF